jgi:hypothetical protein
MEGVGFNNLKRRWESAWRGRTATRWQTHTKGLLSLMTGEGGWLITPAGVAANAGSKLSQMPFVLFFNGDDKAATFA